MVSGNGLEGYLAAVQRRCTLTSMRQSTAEEYAALLSEVRALADYIDYVRRELAVLGADEIVARHVPAAADELDAIVTHTAAATGTILDVCESLEQAHGTSVDRTVISAATARIYEACSFQDITGQRVAKVVRTLQLVEERVAAILMVFGETGRVRDLPIQPMTLVNGPQRPSAAMNQQAIDDLMAARG